MISTSAIKQSSAAVIKGCAGFWLTVGLVLLTVPLSAKAGDDPQNLTQTVESTSEGDVIHNEVTIDIFTGETEAAKEETTDTTAVHIGEALYYDTEDGLFVFRLGSGETPCIRSNVADGMYLNGTVKVIPDEDVTIRIYRNGIEDNSQNPEKISLPGSYVLLISAPGNETKSFSFRIIETYTNAVSYTVPTGFAIDSALVDGIPAVRSNNFISLDTEGSYEIVTTCRASGVSYTLRCKVDHTAPVLKLAAVDENGIARSAVDISDREDGAEIYATLNNKTYDVSRKQSLTETGYYTLTVMDEAGNTNVYSFTIRVYFTMSSIVFFALLGLLLVSLIVYIAVSRTKLKIR